MRTFLKTAFFFLLGAELTALILSAILYLIFSAVFKDKTYPGVKVAGVLVSGKNQKELEKELNLRYLSSLSNLSYLFSNPQATISATGKELSLQPDSGLMARRAFSVGRQTANPYYNFLQIIAAWQGQIDLPFEVSFDAKILDKKIDEFAPNVEKDPVDAVYHFVPNTGPDLKGRVTAFRPSENGLAIDREKINKIILETARDPAYYLLHTTYYSSALPTKVVLPAVSSSTADDLGIKSLLGRGESYFYDSIPGRVYNINLGTSKINGSLIAPNETFSFDTAIGTVSAVFGFAKAYSIKEGKTVLDDGGGVCQVSTTLYRAVLNAGLPVIEREAHSYRVGFYEQGGFLPGMDATVYPPKPDLKFKNDTGGWILIQTNFDEANKKLTFDLFGTSDNRVVSITGPIIVSSAPPPEPVYQDDPTRPVGVVTQVDTAHYGAKVYFKRLVTRLGQPIIDETVWSNYIPWPARFLRGTKS